MPIVGAAAITAAGAIGGGIIASKGAKNAAKAQEQAAREAIAYQERQQAQRQSRYDAAYADYRKRYDAWMKQFYGVDTPASSDGVHAAAAGGARGVAPDTSSVAPMVSAVRQGDTIADLLRGIGNIRANAASAGGDAWGNAFTTAGAGIGSALKNRPQTPQAKVVGDFQTTGVSPKQAGIDPNTFDRGGWSDWDNYLYSGGV